MRSYAAVWSCISPRPRAIFETTRSPLWANNLFTDQELPSTVQDKLMSDLSYEFLRATSVPLHIALSGQINDLGTHIGDLPRKLAAAVDLIEDYSAAHGNITLDALEKPFAAFCKSFIQLHAPQAPANYKNSCTPTTQYYT